MSLSDDPIIVEARNLRTHFKARSGLVASLLGNGDKSVRALDGVDIVIRSRSIVGLVGESGCGKSTLGMTLVRMHEPTGGEVYFKGEAVTRARGAALKRYRRHAQIIFQDPYSSLNPRLTVREIVEEPLRIHKLGDAQERLNSVRQALALVRMPPDEYLDRHPSDLSGGQRQRVAIARALVMKPEFIVADEPVSMLDVSIQAGVLELLDELSRKLGLAILYISHDIATVGYICDRVAVMYLGQVVEEGPVGKILNASAHPYTNRLVAAIPNVDPTVRRKRIELAGDVPSPMNIPPGCRFAARCPYATDLCHAVEPELFDVSPDQRARCHLFLPHDYPSAEGYTRPVREDDHAIKRTADDPGGQLVA